VGNAGTASYTFTVHTVAPVVRSLRGHSAKQAHHIVYKWSSKVAHKRTRKTRQQAQHVLGHQRHQFHHASAPGTIVIHNAPRTAVVGQVEHFSVLLPGQPHTALTYFLHYPDGHEERIPVRTDGRGYSSYTFRVSPYQARRFRETGTVGVEDATGRVLASTHVAIQQRRPAPCVIPVPVRASACTRAAHQRPPHSHARGTRRASVEIVDFLQEGVRWLVQELKGGGR
jgi:hypothetical protein